MSRKINIRLRRTVVISLVLFSIVITAGELMLFKNSLKRDAQHVSLISLVSETETAIMSAWNCSVGFRTTNQDKLTDMRGSIDSIELSLIELQQFLTNYTSGNQKTEINTLISEFEKVKSDFYTLKDHYQTTAPNTDSSDTDLKKLFNTLHYTFQEFTSLIPGYFLVDKQKYRTEIFLVTLINTLIIILAGYIILRLASKLEKTERSLVMKTVEVENRERERIAADLHDDLGALLSGLMIHLQVLKKEWDSNEELVAKLEHLRVIASDALSGLEETIYNLNPPMLARHGLEDSLQRLIKRLNYSGNTHFTFEYKLASEKLDQGTQLLLFRICSELINNTLKHSDASISILRIGNNRKNLKLHYADNGKGFEYDAEKIMERKSGINNIIERVESMNGHWSINTSEGIGVEVDISLPLGNI